MTKTLTFALIAAAAIAGCDQSSHTINGNVPEDPQANLANSAAPVKLPPAIVASHKYRCKDNSLLAIDWLSDGTTKSARATPGTGSGINLAQAEAGGAYTGEGVSLTGGPEVKTITYDGKSCTR